MADEQQSTQTPMPATDASAVAAELAALKGQYAQAQAERDAHALKIAEFETAKLSDSEKIAARLADAEKRASDAEGRSRDTGTRIAVERAARKLNFVDEDDAYRLLDAAKIEFDKATGLPTNVDALLEGLAKAKPHLIAADNAAPATGGSAANAPRPRTGAGGNIDLRGMTPEEFTRRRSEIHQAARDGRIIQ